MSRKKISTTIYVTPEQSDKLRLLHERTKVPVAVYIREGIDLVLRHYAHLLPGQLALDAPSGRRREASRESETKETSKENGSTRSLDRAASNAGHEKADRHEKERDSESDTGAHGKKHGAASGA